MSSLSQAAQGCKKSVPLSQPQHGPEYRSAQLAKLKAKLMAGKRLPTTSASLSQIRHHSEPSTETAGHVLKLSAGSTSIPTSSPNVTVPNNVAPAMVVMDGSNENEVHIHEEKPEIVLKVTDSPSALDNASACTESMVKFANERQEIDEHSEKMGEQTESAVHGSELRNADYEREAAVLGKLTENASNVQTPNDHNGDFNSTRNESQTIAENIKSVFAHIEESRQSAQILAKVNAGLRADRTCERKEPKNSRPSNVKMKETNRPPSTPQSKTPTRILSLHPAPQISPLPPSTTNPKVPKQLAPGMTPKSIPPRPNHWTPSVSARGQRRGFGPDRRHPTRHDRVAEPRPVNNKPRRQNDHDPDEPRTSDMSLERPNDFYHRRDPQVELDELASRHRDLRDWLRFTEWNDRIHRDNYLQRRRRLEELEKERFELLSLEEQDVRAKTARSHRELSGADKFEARNSPGTRRCPAIGDTDTEVVNRNAGRELFETKDKRPWDNEYEDDVARKMRRTDAGRYHIGSSEHHGRGRRRSMREEGEITDHMDARSPQSRMSTPRYSGKVMAFERSEPHDEFGRDLHLRGAASRDNSGTFTDAQHDSPKGPRINRECWYCQARFDTPHLLWVHSRTCRPYSFR